MNYSIADRTTTMQISSLTAAVKDIKRDTFLILDDNIDRLYPQIRDSSAQVFLFKATEQNKSLEQAEKLLNWLLNNHANRHSQILAVGGGITSDLAGWCAANYMRGMRLRFMPTSLIGMIDAAWGGKTAVNFHSVKNLIGCFYPAEKITICPQFLKTLSSEMLLAGKAELLKTALLQKGELLDLISDVNWLSENNITRIIKQAILFKMQLCQKDPFDKKERQLLNLGHTYAHVIESSLQNSITHGKAVAVGLFSAVELSRKLQLVSEQRYKELCHFLITALTEKFCAVNEKEFDVVKADGYNFYKLDKKNTGKNRLILFQDEQIVFKDGIAWLDFLNSIKVIKTED